MAVGDSTTEREVGMAHREVASSQGKRSNDLWKLGRREADPGGMQPIQP